MAHLAVIGSHHVNGVAQLHTELMRKSVFAGFVELYPDRFVNVTNGIAVRRWLKQSNPGLSALLTQRLGFAWENDLEELGRLAGAADEPEFLPPFSRHQAHQQAAARGRGDAAHRRGDRRRFACSTCR